MTELEKIAYTKRFVDKLAEGINPMTDEQVPESELIRNPRISKCFAYVSDILRQVIENGGIQPRGGGLPFEPVSLEKFEYSDAPITVSEIARRISLFKRDQKMENFTYYWIQEYLIQEGFLTVVQKDGKGSRKCVTELGKSIGISEENRIDQQTNQPYIILLYGPDAQRFVIQHIGEILAVKAGRKRRDR